MEYVVITLTVDQAQRAIKDAAEYTGCTQSDITKLLLRGKYIPLPTGAELQLIPIENIDGSIKRHAVQLKSYSIDGLDIQRYIDSDYKDPYVIVVDVHPVKTFSTLKESLDFIQFLTDHFDCPRKIELLHVSNPIIVWHRSGPGEWSQKGLSDREVPKV